MALKPTKRHSAKRFLIYGPPKVGKTQLATDAPKVMLFDVNDGADEFECVRFPFSATPGREHVPTCWDDILRALDFLTTAPHDILTLVIDQLGDIEALIWESVCKRDGKDNIPAYGWGDGYAVAVAEWRVFCAKLDRLRSQRKVTIVLLAHSHRVTVNDPTKTEKYHQLQPQIHTLAQHYIEQWVDVVAFLATEDGVAAGGKNEVGRAFTTGQRVLHCQHEAAFKAGTRLALPERLKVPAESPWSAITEALATNDTGAPVPDSEIAAQLRVAIGGELLRIGDKALDKPADDVVDKAGDDIARLKAILDRLAKKPAIAKEETTDAPNKNQ